MADRGPGVSEHEPSMEEILSSIKRIIAEDNRRESAARSSSSAPVSNDSVLELTEGDSLDDFDRDEAGDDDLLETANAEALSASLSALATLAEPSAKPKIVRSGETSVEQLLREMLRPLLKEWLNQNLPPLVESMVRKEIQRITRKG